MTIWVMEPRDPLLVRDGRPFGPDPGARAISLPFPFPSTIAGGIRTRAGVNEEGSFQYNRQDTQILDHLKKLQVRGPLLMQLAAESEDLTADAWMVPTPLDALLLPPKSAELDDGMSLIEQLVPLQLPSGAQTDLDQQVSWLVGPSSIDDQRKPLQQLSYWTWKNFTKWLLDPLELAGKEVVLTDLGLRGPEREQRMHVSIEAGKEIARDGRLFETSGLEFTAPGSGHQRLTTAKRLAIAVDVNEAGYTIRPGIAGFGGERRMITWRRSNSELSTWAEDVKMKVLEHALVKGPHYRLFLLTPACFKQGYRPGEWFHAEAARCGVVVELKALAVHRPQVISGWDLALGRPKPSRRLTPAGTVFFLSLKGGEQAIRDWIEVTWMQCISDDEQDRRDGFGLAVLGTWSGLPVPMQ